MMCAFFLSTKFQIPPSPPNFLRRQRLLQRLDKGFSRKLILLSAPAGYGKTTLLSDWARQSSERGLRVAWISFTESDDELGLFCDLLSSALALITTNKDLPYPAWRDCTPDNPEMFFTRLLNAICSNLKNDTLLVLEDYHLLLSPEIHKWVTFFLEFIPASFHLAVACRGEVTLPVSRLRTRDQLVELSATDLCMTSNEINTYINECNHLSLSAEALSTLGTRTAGWIAGLQMATLNLRQVSDFHDFIHRFSGTYRFVSDYLEDQVFNCLEPSLQTFLLQTCILSRLNGLLCNTIADCSKSTTFRSCHEILVFLERSGFFLFSLDESRDWFRYHPLLAEFLQAKLLQDYPEQVTLLHHRAALWLDQHNLIDEAIPHAIAAHEYAYASELTIRIADDLLARGQINQILTWIQSLPIDLVQANPRLCLIHATALCFAGQFDAAEPCLRPIEAFLSSQKSFPTDLFELDPGDGIFKNQILDTVSREWGYQTLQGWQATVDILNAMIEYAHNHLQESILLCQRALDHTPLENAPLRSLALMVQGQAFMQVEDLPKAVQTLSEAMYASLIDQNQVIYAGALHSLAQTLRIQGFLRQAAEVYQQGSLAFNGNNEADQCGINRIGLGDLFREQGLFRQSSILINEGLSLAEDSGIYPFRIQGYLAKSRLCFATGDLEGAFDWARQALHLAQRSQAWLDILEIRAYQARLWLATGNLPAAELWAIQIDLPGNPDLSFKGEYLALTFARLLMFQGKLSDAGNLLARLRQSAEAGQKVGRVIEIMILQAIILQLLGASESALHTLAQAVTLAAPESFQCLFVDQGILMVELLNQLARRQSNGLRQVIHQLLDAFPPDLRSAPIPPKNKSTWKIAQLSERELQVLRLIEAGRSYQQIAAELVIALSTVQSHIKNAYAKLDSHSALEAILRARELDLLP